MKIREGREGIKHTLMGLWCTISLVVVIIIIIGNHERMMMRGSGRSRLLMMV